MEIGSLAPVGANAKMGAKAWGIDAPKKYHITTEGCAAYEQYIPEDYAAIKVISEAEAGQTVYIAYATQMPVFESVPEVNLVWAGTTIAGGSVSSFVMPESDVRIKVTGNNEPVFPPSPKGV